MVALAELSGPEECVLGPASLSPAPARVFPVRPPLHAVGLGDEAAAWVSGKLTPTLSLNCPRRLESQRFVCRRCLLCSCPAPVALLRGSGGAFHHSCWTGKH